jgi:hypothetical protein
LTEMASGTGVIVGVGETVGVGVMVGCTRFSLAGTPQAVRLSTRNRDSKAKLLGRLKPVIGQDYTN